jgi:hypothetical protein
MQQDAVIKRQPDTQRVALTERHRCDRQTPGDTQITDRHLWHTWTLTVLLLAARREFDGSITLVIADPTAPSQPQLVAFRGPTAPITADPGLGRRSEQSRIAFLTDFVDPSAEGFDLLYGTAALTLAQAAGCGDRNAGLPVVVDFIALGGAPRGPVTAQCCHHRSPHVAQSR